MCQHYDELPVVTELCVIWMYKVSSSFCRSVLSGLCQKLIRGKSFVLPWKISRRFSLGKKKALYTKEENSVNSGEWDKEMKMKAQLHGPESSK